MIPLTFLAARVPLIKHHLFNKVENYPLVKRFTSFYHEVEASNKGLQEFADHLRSHAANGHCFYKGTLKRALIDESRAGQTEVNNETQLLVIDVDSFPLAAAPIKYSQDDLQRIADYVVSQLPEPLRDVSYIAQASSSLGTKPNCVSLHLFFFMDAPVPPQMLKWWLTYINLYVPTLADHVTLSATGRALHYVVDRCMAENSRIIYIAPPKFDQGLNNPFDDDNDRILLVEKKEVLAKVSQSIRQVNPEKVQTEVDQRIMNMRQAKGLNSHRTKTKMVKVSQAHEEQAIMNPDRAVMRYAYHNNTFCYANLNDGDSNAYYWPLDNPKWVFNFKDEPIFEMAKVDPDFYKWYLEEFREYLVKDAAIRPLVFRDFETDAHYTVEYNPIDNSLIRFAMASRTSLSDFCEQYWEPLPEPIPTWDVFFDPSQEGGLNLDHQKLNLFSPTKYMTLKTDLPADFVGIKYGDAFPALKQVAPWIHELIWHMIGNGEMEYEHFINWLAFVFKFKEKTNVAWIFHGIEGTGKGLFYTQVIRPLFGYRYSVMKRMMELEDKFDGWREHNLITVIDEFRLADATMTSRMYDQLKNMISEPFGTVRHMRTNPKEVPLFSNYMFFSNNEDAMRLSAHDRRFSLGLRQTIKIDMVHNIREMIEGIERELQYFAMFLKEFQVDEHQARVAIENDAKQAMREASNSWVDDFCSAIINGNFNFFLESVLFYKPAKPEETVLQSRCSECISAWLLDSVETGSEFTQVNVEDLRLIYTLTAGKEPRPAEFGKIMSRRGIVAQRLRHHGVPGRYITVKFDFSDYDPYEIVKTHGTPEQRQTIEQFKTH